MKKREQISADQKNSDTRKFRGRKRAGATLPVPPGKGELPDGYGTLLTEIKERIRSERLRVVMAANAAMVLLYWDIGKTILDRQAREGWGSKVIDRLSHDLKATFPDMNGLSPRNLKYMRKFAQAWPDRKIVQAALAQITWYHNLALLEKCSDPETRLWYAAKAAENGWSRNILVMQIECGLHKREGKAINNFELTLRGFVKPIGVADWETRVTETLPDDLKGSLPSIEEIEAELAGMEGKNEEE